jgi:hypothetical protein
MCIRQAADPEVEREGKTLKERQQLKNLNSE